MMIRLLVRLTCLTVVTVLILTSGYLLFSTRFYHASRSHVITSLEGRRSVVHAACRRHNMSSSACQPMTKFIYIDDDFRYVYCLVSKAACTSWKRTLLELHSPDERQMFQAMHFAYVHSHAKTDRYIRRWEHYPPQALEERLAHYYKFIFVREPLERLVSAFRDKILRNKAYAKYHVARIFAKYRHHISPGQHHGPVRFEEYLREPEVRFDEFLRYVVDSWQAGESLDRHWRPQHQICCVCHIDYDFLGHYETLDSDAQRLLAVLQTRNDDSRSSGVSFPRTDPDNQHEGSRDLMTQFYANVSTDLIDKLFRMYHLDYELFGYERPRIGHR